ncbi:MAG TPA: acetylgalactosaminidase, partial [Porphyromonadaceae bacterium]|nr:acetylgalactosaminidase [Porphyromonadaceae bacterium]
MEESRRNFLKKVTIGGVGLSLGSNIYAEESVFTSTGKAPRRKMGEKQSFNMCGYRAPKLETVRVGFIGIGNRGYSNLNQMTFLEGAQIKAICDIVQFRIDEVQQLLVKRKLPKAQVYTGSEEAWKGMCENPDIDLISIAVPRGPLHAQISIYAMKCGKHVAVEVPGISTVDEAWEVVETSERTKKHCYMMENCCYDFFELLTLNMARQGFFGEVFHADAGYLHHQTLYEKTRDLNMWRLEESQHHNGNVYPTHGLGPVCQVMDINRGDKLNRMVSMSSDDFILGKKVAELAQSDPFYKKY